MELKILFWCNGYNFCTCNDGMAEHQVPAFLASYKTLLLTLKNAIVGIKPSSPIGIHLENFRAQLAAHQSFAIGMVAGLGSKMATRNMESANAIASHAAERSRLEKELHDTRQQLFASLGAARTNVVDTPLAQTEADLDSQIAPLLAAFNGDGGSGWCVDPAYDGWRRMNRAQRWWWFYFLWLLCRTECYFFPRLKYLTDLYHCGLNDIDKLRSSNKEQTAVISNLQDIITQYKDTEDSGLPNRYSELKQRLDMMFLTRPDGVTEPIYMAERREKNALEVRLSMALERNSSLEKKRMELKKVRRIARHQHMRLKAHYEDGEDGYESWSSTEEFRRDPGGTNSYYASNGVPIELQQSPNSSPRGDTTMMHSVGGLPGFAWNAQRAACEAGRGF